MRREKENCNQVQTGSCLGCEIQREVVNKIMNDKPVDPREIIRNSRWDCPPGKMVSLRVNKRPKK